ncbi:cupin-like domain-domain-containing protein [Coniella lustricola]|uniref:Cupin-like domain-domain-containing protein n=1 Tax=Coniella lustricola TaxID=2025994 RepID=A0A2T3AM85_9PEZI|nr:cupin-like domain-domain-containing protein [Coniella lustricola]
MEVLHRSWRAAPLRQARRQAVAAASSPLARQQKRCITRSHRVEDCESIDADYDEVMAHPPYATFFKDEVFKDGTPLVMKSPTTLFKPPAMQASTKWFKSLPAGAREEPRKVMSDYLKHHAGVPFPYELNYPQFHRLHGDAVANFLDFLRDWNEVEGLGSALARIVTSHLPPLNSRSRPGQEQYFVRFEAPLALFDAALQFNAFTKYIQPGRVHPAARPPLRNLYIAQASLDSLPSELQQDLPVPRLVKEAGKGDIYGSSIWLGLAHTYTSLHRDPNPNLFIQLYGSKVVRLLPPEEGEKLYALAQNMLGRAGGSSAIRGSEMMEGEEKAFFHRAVWIDGSSEKVVRNLNPPMLQAVLKPGDSLFIPKGWWHTVKSTTEAGELNGSVNWWFR